jgi:hypothetical protein
MNRDMKIGMVVMVGMLLAAGSAEAQSGRATMGGYVAFEGMAYVDKQPVAKVELLREGKVVAATQTGEHGEWEFRPAPLGEFTLRITAAGFGTYEAEIYLPSDFVGRIGTMMKKAAPAKAGKQAKGP